MTLDELKQLPTCGFCHIRMTPNNSTLAPELFLCDECARANGVIDSTTPATPHSPSPAAVMAAPMVLAALNATVDKFGSSRGLEILACLDPVFMAIKEIPADKVADALYALEDILRKRPT